MSAEVIRRGRFAGYTVEGLARLLSNSPALDDGSTGEILDDLLCGGCGALSIKALISLAEAVFGDIEVPSPAAMAAPTFVDEVTNTEFVQRPDHFYRLSDGGSTRALRLTGGLAMVRRGGGSAQDSYLYRSSRMLPPMMRTNSGSVGQEQSEADLIAYETGEAARRPQPAAGRQQFHDDNEAPRQLRSAFEFQPPSRKNAIAYADAYHPRKQDGRKYRVCCGTRTGRLCFPSLDYRAKKRGCVSSAALRVLDPFKEGVRSDLTAFGPGITLHFKFMKFLFWLFFALTALTLPEIYINVSAAESTTFSLDDTMLGSLAHFWGVNASIAQSGGNLPLPLFCGPSDDRFVCSLETSDLRYIYLYTEYAVCFVFFVATLFLKHFHKVEAKVVSKQFATVEEYTVSIKNPPRDVTEEELKTFFESLYGEKVAEVHLARDDTTRIAMFQKKGKLLGDLWKIAGTIHFWSRAKSENRSKYRATALLARARKKYASVLERYKSVSKMRHLASLQAVKASVVGAYITFDTQLGYLKCMKEYGGTRQRLAVSDKWCCIESKRRKLRHQPIHVVAAPPPSTILWQNLPYSFAARQKRRVVSLLFMALCLVLSFVVSGLLQSARDEQLEKDMEAARVCSTKVDMSIYDDLLPYLTKGQTVSGVVTPSEDLLKCYCRELDSAEAFEALTHRGSGCFNYFFAEVAPRLGLKVAASLGITLVNIFLWYVTGVLSKYEKHHSLIHEEFSVTRRMFFAMLVNTAFVLLLVNLRFVKDTDILERVGGIGGGRYRDITFEWYDDVGVEITLSMALTIIAPHSARIMWYLFDRFRRDCSTRLRHRCKWGMGRYASSQRRLNELFLGPVFRLSSRIPQYLMPCFVTMIYSAGMPILYALCTLFFGVFFWVEKYLLLRWYRTPPRYGPKLLNWAAKMMFYALLWHLAFAIWMLSSPLLFDDGSKAAEQASTSGLFDLFASYEPSMKKSPFFYRITRIQTFPLFVIACVLVIFKLMDKTCKWVGRAKAVVVSVLSCGVLDTYKRKRVYLNPPFSVVKENGDLAGLESYSVMQNPLYVRAFAQDAHTHLHRSIDMQRNLADDQLLPPLPGETNGIPMTNMV